MLSDLEKQQLLAAYSGLTETGAPWNSLAPLAKLAKDGTDISIDFTTAQSLGAPVIIANRAAASPAPQMPQVLTNRQRQVCALLAQGQSNKQIAARLGISLATVKDHVHAVLDRLGLQNRSQVAAYLHSPKATG